MAERTPVALRFGEALHGEGVAFEGNLLHAISPVAFAPGRPLEIEADVSGSHFSFRAKSLGSKRRPDERFDVRLRPVNLRREQKQALLQALSSGATAS